MKNHHNQIVCPECNSTFSIDESNYALIAEQVRNKEFNEELEKKVKNEVSQSKKLLESELKEKYTKELSDKNKYITQLRNDMNLQEEQYKNKNKDHNHNDFFLLLGIMPRRSISAMTNMKLFINKIA